MTLKPDPNVDGHVDGLLTVRHVAARLSVLRATVYALVANNALPHLRISNAIRVRQTDLDTYLG